MTARTVTLILLMCLGAFALRPATGYADAPYSEAEGAEAGSNAPMRKQRLELLAQGTMAKLRIADERTLLPDVSLSAPDGTTHRLSDWRGRTLLLHFWASWCAPCQSEIPQIARLEARIHDDALALLAVSLDKSPAEAQRFLVSLGVTSLPLASDPHGTSAAALGARGLPTSIFVDPGGREIGRLEGSGEWLSDDAILLIKALLADAREAPLPTRSPLKDP